MTQPKRAISTTGQSVDGSYFTRKREYEYCIRGIAEIQLIMKEYKKAIELQTRETKLIREMLEKCDVCKGNLKNPFKFFNLFY